MNRERIQILRDHLAALPDAKFDMRAWVSGDDWRTETVLHDCGTAACIGGWAEALFAGAEDLNETSGPTRHLLGLNIDDANALFCPPWYQLAGRYSRQQAIQTLDHLLATGEVKWPD